MFEDSTIQRFLCCLRKRFGFYVRHPPEISNDQLLNSSRQFREFPFEITIVSRSSRAASVAQRDCLRELGNMPIPFIYSFLQPIVGPANLSDIIIMFARSFLQLSITSLQNQEFFFSCAVLFLQLPEGSSDSLLSGSVKF